LGQFAQKSKVRAYLISEGMPGGLGPVDRPSLAEDGGYMVGHRAGCGAVIETKIGQTTKAGSKPREISKSFSAFIPAGLSTAGILFGCLTTISKSLRC